MYLPFNEVDVLVYPSWVMQVTIQFLKKYSTYSVDIVHIGCDGWWLRCKFYRYLKDGNTKAIGSPFN